MILADSISSVHCIGKSHKGCKDPLHEILSKYILLNAFDEAGRIPRLDILPNLPVGRAMPSLTMLCFHLGMVRKEP